MKRDHDFFFQQITSRLEGEVGEQSEPDERAPGSRAKPTPPSQNPHEAQIEPGRAIFPSFCPGHKIAQRTVSSLPVVGFVGPYQHKKTDLPHNISMMVEIIVLLWLVVLGPLLDIPFTKYLKTSDNPNRRIYGYAATIFVLILATAVVWPIHQTKLIESPFPPAPRALQVIAWSLVAAMGANSIQLWLMSRQSPQKKLEIHRAFATLDFFLPTTRIERSWFAGVALAAGIFEEILFRSFIIRFFDGVPLWASAMISAFLFGIAHMYQGWKNAIGTLVMALVFTVIVAGTGQIIVAMVAHALWDLRVLVFMLPSDAAEELEKLNQKLSPEVVG